MAGKPVYLMATDRGSKHYPGFLIYGVAFYAFCKVISAIVTFVKSHRRQAAVRMAMKTIGLVDAMVSLLMLEVALIGTFGEIHTPWARMMMTISGSCVSLITIGVGIWGIRWYFRTK